MHPRHQQAAAKSRREKVATLYLHRLSQAEIAATLGVTQQQISYDLKVLQGEWLASSLRDFDAAKAVELQRIDAVEVEYWSAWARSTQPREITVTEATEGGELMAPDGTLHPRSPTRKASMRREGQAGDPRYLDGILKCIERRCAILGLDAPRRFQIKWDELSEDQLRRLAAGEEPAQVVGEGMAEA